MLPALRVPTQNNDNARSICTYSRLMNSGNGSTWTMSGCLFWFRGKCHYERGISEPQWIQHLTSSENNNILGTAPVRSMDSKMGTEDERAESDRLTWLKERHKEGAELSWTCMSIMIQSQWTLSRCSCGMASSTTPNPRCIFFESVIHPRSTHLNSNFRFLRFNIPLGIPWVFPKLAAKVESSGRMYNPNGSDISQFESSSVEIL